MTYKYDPGADYDVTVGDGKYRLIYRFTGASDACEVHRHGEPWPAGKELCQHTKVVSALVHRIWELEQGLGVLAIADADASTPEIVWRRVRAIARRILRGQVADGKNVVPRQVVVDIMNEGGSP